MKNLRLVYLLLPLLVFLSGCSLLRPVTVPADARSDQFMRDGKRLFNSRSYQRALDAFEMVLERKFNRNTTAAIYLSGLSAYYLGWDGVAEKKLNNIIFEFPRSRYVEDATYHLALINMRDPASKNGYEQGLEKLLELSSKSKNKALSRDAMNMVRQELFANSPADFLDAYRKKVPQQHVKMVTEAFLYRKVKDGEAAEARTVYEEYLNNRGENSPFLKLLFPGEFDLQENVKPAFEPNILRIALMLPMHLTNAGYSYQSEIPEESTRGLEFYEGFKIAIDEYKERTRKNIYLKVFDTNRDTILTRIHVRQLDSLKPNIVIGGIYNSQSKIISEWAETRKVPQIVPISATESLIENKQFTFLAHPTGKTHGAAMAAYAWNELQLLNVFIFSDRGNGTQQLTDGFAEEFTKLGGSVDTLFFSRNYELAVEQIPELVDRLPEEAMGSGVYIPLMGNEESASLIVNVMQQKSKFLPVMGSPHFRSRYNTLSRDTKDALNLLFTTSNLKNLDSEAYINLYNLYLRDFHYPPSDNVIQGYDLGQYIMSVLDKYDPSGKFPLETYLKIEPVMKSIHLDYQFNATQSNQRVNIGQYTEEGIKKVN